MESVLHKMLNKYNNTSVAARASLWFVICGFLQKGISVITTPIFTRLMTTSEYGQYNTFNSWMNIIVVFATLRLSYSAYMQGLIRYEDDRDKYTSSLLGLSMSLVSIFALVYFVFHKKISQFFEISPMMMMCMLIMMMMAVSFEFWSARQRVDFVYKKLVIVTLLMSVLNPVLGILAVSIFANKVEARIVEITLVEVCCYGVFLFSQFAKGKTFFSKKYWKYALAFSTPLIPHYLSQTILNQSDRLMIQKICGMSETGVYSLAYNVASILVIVNTALANSYSPWLFKKIKEKQLDNISSISIIMLVLVACANLALIVFAPEAVLFFGSEKYYDAIWVIPPVAMGVYYMFLYSMFATVEMYFAKTKYMMVSSSVGAVLNLALNYLLIPKFGYVAAAYTTLICYITYSCMHMFFMKKTCIENLGGTSLYDLSKIFWFSIAFCVVGFVFMMTYTHTFIRYGIILIGIFLCITFRKRLMSIGKEIIKIRQR